MIKSKSTTDILHGALTKSIVLFTLPIAASSMLQQFFHAVDTSVVGYFINANALAAVGANGEIIALIVTVSAGLAVGVNVLVANQIGSKNLSCITDIFHTAYILAVFIGIAGLLVGQYLAAPLLAQLNTPSDVQADAILYLKIYLAGYPFLLLYDFGSAILRAYGNSRYPFFVLTGTGVLNIVLNICFVVYCKIGVAGVAAATDIATALSAFFVFFRVCRIYPNFLPLSKGIKIYTSYCIAILKIGIPSAIQGAAFCFANLFVQVSVNSFGAVSTAGSTIAMNFEYFVYYIIIAFGQTATTFTGQNYVANQLERCKSILKRCLFFSVLCSTLIVIPLVIFRTSISGLFSVEPAVIENSCLRILCILALEPICSLYEIPAGILRGCGHAAEPAVITLTGTCVFRIGWICTVFQYAHELPVLFVAFPISWFITIAGMWIVFARIKPFRMPA